MDKGTGRRNRFGHKAARVERRKTALFASALAAVTFTLLSSWATSASAEVPAADRKCIVKFNKGIRKVVKAHGKIVKKCLKDFASGALTVAPEKCLASDPRNKLQRTVDRDRAKVDRACSEGLPSFGVSDLDSAPGRAVLNQFSLVRETVGLDLDINLIPSDAEATCQAKVLTALVECEDARLREYVKCLQVGLRSPLVTDAASLTAVCLGTGSQPQPDGTYNSGRIAASCIDDITTAIERNCEGIDLLQAFSLCEANNVNDLRECLTRQSACQVCQMLNDVDGLVRDCDSMDDGVDNGSCEAECSDGLIHRTEGCDDGDGESGDGCSDHCQIEAGWSCTGEPSVCTMNCGDGNVDPEEACDDGDTEDGDGCSSTCEIESGYTCTGEPSVCIPFCGNGDVQTDEDEACDDGDTSSGDGCSSTCQLEEGWLCTGEPSVCTFVCGNGTFQTGETCDDGDATGGDGCSAVCKLEPGWLCSGSPSLCAPVCGDGLIRGNEVCDDGDATSGDGCSNVCHVESGFQCAGQPSICSAICGDGFMRGMETCDDGNTQSGDGCSGKLCRQESDWACLGQPSNCVAMCGDGDIDGLEQCDDGNLLNGDGCAANCTVEPGQSCLGTPSLCFSTCGNGTLDSGEECDDGNTVAGDGCGSGCIKEPGWLCPTPGWPCEDFQVFIDTPTHGIFTTAGSVVVSGHYTTLPAGRVSLTVNGVPPSTLNTTARTFSHTVGLSQAQVTNSIRVTLTDTATGEQVRDRVVVIAGQSVGDHEYSPASGALRLNDTGLDSVEPLVGDLAAGAFDIGGLMPPGQVVSDDCAIHFIGCLGKARVTIAHPPPTIGGIGLALDSKTNAVFGKIDIFNLRVDVNIDGTGLVPDCTMRMRANVMSLTGDYALEPLDGSPSNVDVNLASPIGVSFSGFSRTFTSGLCNAPIIGDIIQALMPDVQKMAEDGIKDTLKDPDGAGPEDSPIAEGIQTTLAGISIAGPVGEGVGLMLDAPLFAVNEDNSGITLGSDIKFTTSVGSGPGQCIPPPAAPDLTRSYSKFEPFPAFGATTPVGNKPYGLGICISTAGFNQLLRGQTECGLMRTSLTSIDIDGGGPLPSVNIDSTLLSVLVPEFGQLPPGTPLRIDVYPTLAPIVTGNTGPNGALTELKIGQMMVEIVQPGPEIVWLAGALDIRLGMSLNFLPDGSGLAVTITTPTAQDISLTVIENPLWTNQVAVETMLPGIMIPLIPDLAGALSGFPLPQFFGLSIEGVEVSKNGQFLSLFANLNAN